MRGPRPVRKYSVPLNSIARRYRLARIETIASRHFTSATRGGTFSVPAQHRAVLPRTDTEIDQ
jgi:hypothetical protein